MRILAALLLCFWASVAWAQNPTCPTRPPSDSTNACASTAFVQNAVGVGATIVCGLTPVTSCSSGGYMFNNGGVLGSSTAVFAPLASQLGAL